MIQSKCLRIATGAPWYTGNRHIHEDLGVPFFAAQRCLARHFSAALTEVFRDFSSVVRRMPRYNAKTGHGPHSP